MPAGIFAMEGMGDPSATEGLVAMLATFFPICMMGIFMLIGAAFVLYGLYGGVRVLQGHIIATASLEQD